MNYIIRCGCGNTLKLLAEVTCIVCPTCHREYSLDASLDDSRVDIAVDPEI